MKIAQIVSTFPPYRGGMGNVAYYLADYLSREGFDVSVFTPSQNYLDDDYKSFFNVYYLTPLVRIGNSAIVFQLFYRCFNYEIIHLHYPFLGGVLPIILIKLIRGKKVKLIIHYHMDLVGQGPKKLIFKIYNKLFLRSLVAIADRVIVTTLDYANESIIGPWLRKKPAKFVEIYNGVDLSNFRPKSRSLVLERNYHLENKKIILFVGALDSAHYFKGINFLLKAFELLNRPDVKLIIVGEGNLKEVYRDLAESYRIDEKVIFTGYVPDESLVDFYNLADIFVLPSIDKSEAFGMVLLEAMACAKPVIASDLPGVRRVVGIKESGRIVKPKDVKKLAENIAYLLDHDEERKRIGELGRKRMEKIYGWETIIKKLIELYQQETQ